MFIVCSVCAHSLYMYVSSFDNTPVTTSKATEECPYREVCQRFLKTLNLPGKSYVVYDHLMLYVSLAVKDVRHSICDQICKKGSYMRTTSIHRFYHHLIATLMNNPCMCV